MYHLKTEQCFDAAHFLNGYVGKCSNLHGHRWRVVARVSAHALDQEGQTRGMLVDFSTLKKDLKALCEELDHSLIYEHGSLRPATVAALKEEQFRLVEVPFRPTAEEFSRFFFEKLTAQGYPVTLVEVYETPANSACYEG
jgi:6-pyruvoyltetrahydropterin/6-carboxytetrahydropterin synthase